MENNKPERQTIKIQLRPMTVNYNLAMEELRREYGKIVGVYEAAIREIDARLQTLNSEFSLKHQHNPIHHIESRVKSLGSIVKKLHDTGIPISIDNAKKNLHDIAGVRVVCRYVDDIYKIADLLMKQDDISVILQKDYIQNPKPNGYRSLHIVVDVPVYMSQGKLYIPVEIQIRTVAMDFWATLEHGIRYKATDEVPPSIVAELRACADVITETDYKMQNIFRVLQSVHDRDDIPPELIVDDRQ
ncbi:MAG: GTP pyrophosphokinase family protein [Clostridia bacterium]|nr:GTP pyrophosphokinase family protein [Clostridia bacterium]